MTDTGLGFGRGKFRDRRTLMSSDSHASAYLRGSGVAECAMVCSLAWNSPGKTNFISFAHGPKVANRTCEFKLRRLRNAGRAATCNHRKHSNTDEQSQFCRSPTLRPPQSQVLCK